MIRIRAQAKTIDRLYVVSLFFTTVFFFGPAQIFLSNLDGFPLPTAAVIRFLVGVTLVGIVLAMMLISVIPEAVAGRVVSLLLATAFLLWLQGSILVWDYGPLNGLDIEWGKKMHLGLIDTPLWIFLLILAFIHSAIIKKNRPAAEFGPDRSPTDKYFILRGSKHPK